MDRVHPTYPEIKDYVFEHYGFKVSNLNIAQVKQKCGLDMRENYNKPRTENSRTCTCPSDKEQAIIAAFQHFGMI